MSMHYLELGCSGLKVAELCLGTMTFGEESGFGAPAAESRRIYERYREAGGNFLDTANIYNRGTSETLLGDFIASERQAVVLASKYSLTTDPADPNAGGNHRKNLVQSLEASLRRLRTDYLDLYWVHGWDQATPLAELMRALDDQVRLGKVLHLGISNAPAWVVAAANVLARERGWTPFTALQLHYNLVERSIEEEFFALAAAQDLAITAWSPLAGGLLSGKFNRDADPQARAGARLESSPMRSRMLTEQRLEAAEHLAALARELGASAAQLALAWLRQRGGGDVIPILGARTLAQLDDNLGALKLALAPVTIAELDSLSPPEFRYPRALLDGEFFQRMLHGGHQARPRSGQRL